MRNKKNLVLTTLTMMGAALLVFTTARSRGNQQGNKIEGSWGSKVPGSPMQWTTPTKSGLNT